MTIGAISVPPTPSMIIDRPVGSSAKMSAAASDTADVAAPVSIITATGLPFSVAATIGRAFGIGSSGRSTTRFTWQDAGPPSEQPDRSRRPASQPAIDRRPIRRPDMPRSIVTAGGSVRY